MNKSFCILPWNNVSVDPDGSIKPCCVSLDFIKKPDGTKYNLGHDKIEDFYNSPDYVNIREKMLKGEEVPGCIKCTQVESYGSESRRIASNNRFADQLNKTSSIAETAIEYFDLRFGNLCNLKCKSCIPINSSQLDKQVLEHPELKKYYHNSNYNINEWYETEIYAENVYSNLHNIKLLYITGGEPTLIKKNFELLEKLIDAGYSKNIKLIINSNMTNDKTNFFDLLGKFKEVTFFASIDGYGLTQEYIRYPSDWNQVSKNLTKLVDRQSENIMIRVAPVVQITNLNNIVDLFEFCEEFNRKAGKNVVDIFLVNLEFPKYLKITNLPVEYKKQCWERIENWVKTKCIYQKPLFHEQLVSVKNMCFMDTDYKEMLDEFFTFNATVDKHQNLTIEQVNPELAQLQYK
jgi:organic radical activating enzyme